MNFCHSPPHPGPPGFLLPLLLTLKRPLKWGIICCEVQRAELQHPQCLPDARPLLQHFPRYSSSLCWDGYLPTPTTSYSIVAQNQALGRPPLLGSSRYSSKLFLILTFFFLLGNTILLKSSKIHKRPQISKAKTHGLRVETGLLHCNLNKVTCYGILV